MYILDCFIKNKRLPGYAACAKGSRTCQSEPKDVNSAEDCQKKCQEAESCKAFIFKNKQPRRCNLKNTADISLFVNSKSYIFGPKYCPGKYPGHTVLDVFVYIIFLLCIFE